MQVRSCMLISKEENKLRKKGKGRERIKSVKGKERGLLEVNVVNDFWLGQRISRIWLFVVSFEKLFLIISKRCPITVCNCDSILKIMKSLERTKKNNLKKNNRKVKQSQVSQITFLIVPAKNALA